MLWESVAMSVLAWVTGFITGILVMHIGRDE